MFRPYDRCEYRQTVLIFPSNGFYAAIKVNIIMDQFKWADPPSRTAFPVAAPGYPFIYAAAFATVIFALIGFTVLAIIGLLATIGICLFFRDPDRATPAAANALVAPADGRVVFARKIDDNPYIDGPCIKVGIFMSVFNVHVNRMPFSGTISDIRYYPGKFFSADKDKASFENERNAVILQTVDNRTIGVVQVAGLIARRIISWVNVDETVETGHRFGLICFGSRVDLYLPEEAEVSVKPGDKVTAGFTIIGRLPDPAE